MNDRQEQLQALPSTSRGRLLLNLPFCQKNEVEWCKQTLVLWVVQSRSDVATFQLSTENLSVRDYILHKIPFTHEQVDVEETEVDVFIVIDNRNSWPSQLGKHTVFNAVTGVRRWTTNSRPGRFNGVMYVTAENPARALMGVFLTGQVENLLVLGAELMVVIHADVSRSLKAPWQSTGGVLSLFRVLRKVCL